MKVKSLVGLCKRNKSIFLYNNASNNLQYMGDGCAVYPLFKMPKLNENNIFAIFDIPEKQQNKIMFTETEFPKGINLNDVCDHETMIESENINISVASRTLIPIKASQGLIFINAAYLEPLSDIADSIELYERITDSGKAYIAVKNGFILMGVIQPYDLVNKEFVKQMEDLTNQCKLALMNKNQTEPFTGSND